jgi:hypothetical protein
MIPGNSTIHAIVGVQQTITRTWKQAIKVNGVVTAGLPIDTTGYSARFAVAKQGVATAIIDLTTANGAVQLTPSTGSIEVNLSRTAMAVAPGEYHYYLVLTSPSGRDYPLLTGRFVVAVTGLPL